MKCIFHQPQPGLRGRAFASDVPASGVARIQFALGGTCQGPAFNPEKKLEI
jgi:hypothetical protein